MNSSLLLVIVVILLCCGSLVNKQAIRCAHPLTIQYLQCMLNCCLLPVWWWLARKFAPTEIFNLRVFGLAALGSLISTVGFLLFLTALKEKPISVAVCFLSTYPALTMLVCCYLGLEKLTLPRVFGVSCVLFGTMVIQLFDK